MQDMDILKENLLALDSWRPDPQANYGGSERKAGLIAPDGARYMVKYTERQAQALRNDFTGDFVNNALSEHMASRMLSIFGYDAHETFLGLLNGEIVAACRNFITGKAALVEFEKFMRRHYDSREMRRLPDIRQIIGIMHSDPVLSPQAEDFVGRYWDLFVGDALLGNFDRHAGNFGYLVDRDGTVVAAPVYDNGSALYPRLSDKGMGMILDDPREIMMRIRLFPKAAVIENGRKADYRDMMTSGLYGGLTDAVIRIVPEIRTRLPKASAFIDACDFLSKTRKTFYKAMLSARMTFILEPAYEACLSGRFDMRARERLSKGKEYSAKDFEDDWKAHGAEWKEKLADAIGSCPHCAAPR